MFPTKHKLSTGERDGLIVGAVGGMILAYVINSAHLWGWFWGIVIVGAFLGYVFSDGA